MFQTICHTCRTHSGKFIYFKGKGSMLLSVGDMGEKFTNNECIYKESVIDAVGEKCKRDSLFQTIGGSDGSAHLLA